VYFIHPVYLPAVSWIVPEHFERLGVNENIPPRTPHHLFPFVVDCSKTLDSRLTLREACRICATVTGSVAVIARPSQREVGPGPPGQTEEMEELLSVGDDSLGPEEFARALYHCGDLKTWDGMCPVPQVRSYRDDGPSVAGNERGSVNNPPVLLQTKSPILGNVSSFRHPPPLIHQHTHQHTKLMRAGRGAASAKNDVAAWLV